ncbi:elongation of very long chain fatty acids protein AAEL008004 [Drosophila innubila]|uniref:elongation of very long chain fatty acids protein AAEL008004 n=1 Tax=Drosophila innubila TaxID=198719 RepID=UPI00148C8721|nr:elongation of very long chain fatty acids protein AAEL008004 [Drosophila innubila]
MDAAISIEHPELMVTPWFMIAVLVLYLIFVLRIGPNFMLNRRPYELKTLIIVHNIVQVVSCVYVVYEILHITENHIIYFWKCSALEFVGEKTKRHFKLAYFLFWLKLSELIETIIFVLRKKQNQVTKLHVFHHISTITLIYLLINHNSNGFDALFPIFLNSIIHIIMYSYYLVAAVADKSIIRALTPVKKSITVMQMGQFSLILIHAILTSMNCGVDKAAFIYFIFVIILMFYGFYDFYQISYKSSKRRKSAVVAESAEAAAAVNKTK